MSLVSIQKVKEASQSRPLLQETFDLLENVRKRAYELFERRGGAPGNDIADWLQAESEVFQVPRMELSETDREFELQVATPGLGAKDLRIAALPHAIIVEGEATHRHSGTKRNIRACEFGERKLFREIPLPEPVDVDHVSASLDKGLLQIRAAKASQNGGKKTAARDASHPNRRRRTEREGQ
jgi:HSP20 family protein